MTARITSAALAIGASVSCAVAAFGRPGRVGAAVGSRCGELRGPGQGLGGQHRRRARCATNRCSPSRSRAYFVDNPVCNNWADIGLPEVYNDPDLASFNGASTQTSPTDQTHFVKQAVGVFATAPAAGAAFHRVVDRTIGCAGQTTPMHLDNGTTQVWSFDGGPAGPADAAWSKQEAGTDRRCFTQTRLRENVLLQAKVCQSGNGGPAVNVLAGAMQNALGQ